MFTFKLFGKTHTAATLADASLVYSTLRDQSGRGASSMPTPELLWNGETFGHFSYNGRIWDKPSRDWTADSVMLFPTTINSFA